MPTTVGCFIDSCLRLIVFAWWLFGCEYTGVGWSFKVLVGVLDVFTVCFDLGLIGFAFD